MTYSSPNTNTYGDHANQSAHLDVMGSCQSAQHTHKLEPLNVSATVAQGN